MATRKTGSRKPRPVTKKARPARKPATTKKATRLTKPPVSTKSAAEKRAAIADARRKLGHAKYREVAATAKAMLKQGKPTHVVAAAVGRVVKGTTSGIDALYITDCLA